MSDFTNEAIQVTRRLEEISELLANGDLGRNAEDDLYYERAELEEKDRYLSAYFDVVNKNQLLQTKLAESEARFGRLSFALYYVINNSTVQNNYPHEVGIVEEILNETKSQSLQHIQAEAIAGYYEYICLHVDYSGDIPTPEEYTDQQANGSDGDE